MPGFGDTVDKRGEQVVGEGGARTDRDPAGTHFGHHPALSRSRVAAPFAAPDMGHSGESVTTENLDGVAPAAGAQGDPKPLFFAEWAGVLSLDPDLCRQRLGRIDDVFCKCVGQRDLADEGIAAAHSEGEIGARISGVDGRGAHLDLEPAGGRDGERRAPKLTVRPVFGTVDPAVWGGRGGAAKPNLGSAKGTVKRASREVGADERAHQVKCFESGRPSPSSQRPLSGSVIGERLGHGPSEPRLAEQSGAQPLHAVCSDEFGQFSTAIDPGQHPLFEGLPDQAALTMRAALDDHRACSVGTDQPDLALPRRLREVPKVAIDPLSGNLEFGLARSAIRGLTYEASEAKFGPFAVDAGDHPHPGSLKPPEPDRGRSLGPDTNLTEHALAEIESPIAYFSYFFLFFFCISIAR